MEGDPDVVVLAEERRVNVKAAAVIDSGARELEAQLEGHRVTGVDAVGRVAQIEDGQGRLRLSRIGAVVVLGKNAHLLLQRGVGGIHRAVAAVVALLIAFFAAAACRFKDQREATQVEKSFTAFRGFRNSLAADVGGLGDIQRRGVKLAVLIRHVDLDVDDVGDLISFEVADLDRNALAESFQIKLLAAGEDGYVVDVNRLGGGGVAGLDSVDLLGALLRDHDDLQGRVGREKAAHLKEASVRGSGDRVLIGSRLLLHGLLGGRGRGLDRRLNFGGRALDDFLVRGAVGHTEEDRVEVLRVKLVVECAGRIVLVDVAGHDAAHRVDAVALGNDGEANAFLLRKKLAFDPHLDGLIRFDNNGLVVIIHPDRVKVVDTLVQTLLELLLQPQAFTGRNTGDAIALRSRLERARQRDRQILAAADPVDQLVDLRFFRGLDRRLDCRLNRGFDRRLCRRFLRRLNLRFFRRFDRGLNRGLSRRFDCRFCSVGRFRGRLHHDVRDGRRGFLDRLLQSAGYDLRGKEADHHNQRQQE